jgi:hypothetical protein
MNWGNRYIHKEQEEHNKQYLQIQSASRPRPNCFPSTFKAEFCANENDVIAYITKVKKHTILSEDRANHSAGCRFITMFIDPATGQAKYRTSTSRPEMHSVQSAYKYFK